MTDLLLHPIVNAISRSALAWATPDQANAQARLIAIELIENGLIPDGVVEHGMPLLGRKAGDK